MSGREWKRGEVGTFSGKPALRTAKGWTHYDGSVGGLHQDNSPFLRPLVVIDPEDREQVERLIVAYSSQPRWHTGYTRDRIDAMQAALREFANPTPPKPAEPTGLGAVVEDAEGRIYTRYEKAGPKHEPQPWWQSANGPEHDVVRRFSWSDIDAVRVLSEGVTP